MSPELQATSEATITARIVRQVMAGAEQGTYKISERLPSERELAEKLMVSRTTVTAAYSRLEQQGVIRRIHGKGAYLCALPSCEDAFSWSGKVSRFANAMDEPVLELLALRCVDRVLHPFSAGTPSLEIFPREQYTEALNRVVAAHLPTALAVAPTEGQWALRSSLAQWLGVPPGNIMITAGAQEGIDLLARCLVEPGDYVVVDSPTYPGVLQSFESAGARLLPWNVGWSLGQLEDLLLRFRPKLIFTMPTFQNPTGRVMTLKTRTALLELARRYQTPLVEDDVYGRTFFGQHPVPSSLYALDEGAHVVHLSTFSKMLAPGLRIGWLVAPLYMIKQLALIKMRSNLFTGGLNQLILSDMVASGQMEEHLKRLRRHHQALCEVAMEALRPAIEEGLVSCRVPGGGLYLWCKLLFAVKEERFLALLETQGVSVAPGAAFRLDRRRETSTTFRLCFTAVPRSNLVEGIQILHRTLQELHREGAARQQMAPSCVLAKRNVHPKARAR